MIQNGRESPQITPKLPGEHQTTTVDGQEQTVEWADLQGDVWLQMSDVSLIF